MWNWEFAPRAYFKLPAWGYQGVSKEILLILSKFHENIAIRSGDTEKFLPRVV